MEKTVIRYILNWTEENIYTDSGVDRLISEVGYSRSTIEQWFRRSCGLSLGEYLMRRRMSRAAILLRLTALSITEIAELFHFHSSQNFARAFKRMTGTSPTEYRKQSDWLFHILQQPLLMNGAKYESRGECLLPELMIYGSKFYFQDSIILSSKNEPNKEIKNAVLSQKNKDDKEISMAFRVLPSESLESGRSAILDVEMIMEGIENDSNELVVIPAGRYAEFIFSGSWSEYAVFSRLVYFSLAQEKKYVRRSGYDLIYFSHNEGDEIRCRHLVPVS